jgi:hypothetical protein
MKDKYYIKLFKEYKDIFSWMYEYLKTYDTKIIQHIIPIEASNKTFSTKVEKDAP